jgi:hypothetical protein
MTRYLVTEASGGIETPQNLNLSNLSNYVDSPSPRAGDGALVPLSVATAFKCRVVIGLKFGRVLPVQASTI